MKDFVGGNIPNFSSSSPLVGMDYWERAMSIDMKIHRNLKMFSARFQYYLKNAVLPLTFQHIVK
jgi:hypothetical protein